MRPSPLDGFVGRIARSRPPVLYRLGLAVVALVMVLLPAVYVALILLVGWGVWLHAANDLSVLGHGGWVGLLLYAGPIVVGATLVLFMVKPLFARQPPPPPAVALEGEQESLLFAFIGRICGLVGAPPPSRVEVNCVVNAAASFRRGVLSFIGQDLTLTIGLPLVAGLSMRQFAGVLAHEFGHFSQGAGMRLTYVIRRINHWFFRVVHERDQWDLELDRAAETADIRIGVVLHAARACVWLSRRILWVLMQAGHAVSCFMLRQMELDADRCECQVAGSATFRETMLRIEELNAGNAAAFVALRASWKMRRLPDSLPLFIVGTSAQIEPEVREEIGRRAGEKKTGVFDTHPCDADRIQAAAELDAPGVFRSTAPAAALFRDFPSLSRQVTRFCYEREHDLPIKDDNLVDSEAYLRESTSRQATRALFASYFGEVSTTSHPVSIPAGEIQPAPDPEADLAELRSARERMKAATTAARTASEALRSLEDRLIEASKADALVRAGFTVRRTDFDLEPGTRAVPLMIERLQAQKARSGAPLSEFSLCARARLCAALRQLASPSRAGRIADAPALQEEVRGLVHALNALAQALPVLHELGRTFSAFQLLLANRSGHSDLLKVEGVLADLAGRLRTLLKQVSDCTAGVGHPFPNARGAITLDQFVQPEPGGGDRFEAVMNESLACLERLFPLYHDVLCRLAQIAVQAEAALAPEPAPAPGGN